MDTPLYMVLPGSHVYHVGREVANPKRHRYWFPKPIKGFCGVAIKPRKSGRLHRGVPSDKQLCPSCATQMEPWVHEIVRVQLPQTVGLMRTRFKVCVYREHLELVSQYQGDFMVDFLTAKDGHGVDHFTVPLHVDGFARGMPQTSPYTMASRLVSAMNAAIEARNATSTTWNAATEELLFEDL